MNISVNNKKNTFHLYNDEISYIISVLPTRHLGQLYYGRRIREREDYSWLLELRDRPLSSWTVKEGQKYSLEHIRQEYGVFGSTDYRSPAAEVVSSNGSRISDFRFADYRILAGKPELPGLPATYTEDDSEAMTLIVTLRDDLNGLELELYYTIFDQCGAIARSARFVNNGTEDLHLTTAMSLCLDLPDSDYDWIQFSGAWARERYPKVRRLEQGIQSVGSMRGNSSHNHNPFFILKRPTADEFQGEAIGFSLVYSGNFLAQAEVDTYDTTRVLMGIHPSCFDWKLAPGESFQTPEAVISYTDQGLNGLSRNFHRLYQKRLARGYWRDRERPILINNWEATYFDFNEEEILNIAQKAKECGVELFVLDDGWFGARNTERAGLGDWYVNQDKLPAGISGLAEKIENMGMKFGLWFEPEMVNEDSDLFRAHPDWIIRTPGRETSYGRHQLVLDFSRKEVVDYIYEKICAVLDQGNVEYIKWDMNRSIADVYSATGDGQGRVLYDYVLGLYDFLERIVQRYPDILIEGCSGGGGRFDAGMLYYSPQIWCSDNTDPIDRLEIQYGTSFIYPVSSVGSHVSASPNHQTGRVTSLKTRAVTAMAGTFGYELNLNNLSEEEKDEIRSQIKEYKKHARLVQQGLYYRLTNPQSEDTGAWEFVSEDGKEALVQAVTIRQHANMDVSYIKIRGLRENTEYREMESGRKYNSTALMEAGIPVPVELGEYRAYQWHFVQED